MDQELLHWKIFPKVHFLKLKEYVTIGFKVSGALNHIENLSSKIIHEVEAHKILIIRLFENFDIDWNISKVFVHIISLNCVSLL